MDDTSKKPPDLRAARRERNREAVVQALLDLIQEGELEPTTAQIADRAGVARRSIYHYFTDLETLIAAVAEQHFRRLVDVLVPVPDGTFEQRLRAFTRNRCTLLERALPVYRAALGASTRSRIIADNIALGHVYLRDEAAQAFRDELRHARSWQVETLDLVTSVDAWLRLRVVQGLSETSARRTMRSAIVAVLHGDPRVS